MEVINTSSSFFLKGSRFIREPFNFSSSDKLSLCLIIIYNNNHTCRFITSLSLIAMKLGVVNLFQLCPGKHFIENAPTVMLFQIFKRRSEQIQGQLFILRCILCIPLTL